MRAPSAPPRDRRDAELGTPKVGRRIAAGEIDQVGDHRRRGGSAAGAAALVHDEADRIALDDHGVEDAVDPGDRRVRSGPCRVQPLLEPGRRHPGRAQELDPIAELVGERDVERDDVADALDVDGVEIGRGRRTRWRRAGPACARRRCRRRRSRDRPRRSPASAPRRARRANSRPVSRMIVRM